MGNYITIFKKLLDIINWDTLKKSTYKLDIDYNVYIPILNELIFNALEKLPVNEKFQKFGTIKLIDSSTISMAKTYFQWAEFRSKKSGIKLHTKFNLNKGVPELIVVSNAKPHDKSKMKELITKNNCIYIFEYTSEDIAWLYKKRWEIELFFKWIKQNLKIKRFIGHSLNAVMMQIVSAIITFIIVKLIQNLAKTAYGLLKTKQLIKHSITKLIDNILFSWEKWLGG